MIIIAPQFEWETFLKMTASLKRDAVISIGAHKDLRAFCKVISQVFPELDFKILIILTAIIHNDDDLIALKLSEHLKSALTEECDGLLLTGNLTEWAKALNNIPKRGKMKDELEDIKVVIDKLNHELKNLN